LTLCTMLLAVPHRANPKRWCIYASFKRAWMERRPTLRNISIQFKNLCKLSINQAPAAAANTESRRAGHPDPAQPSVWVYAHADVRRPPPATSARGGTRPRRRPPEACVRPAGTTPPAHLLRPSLAPWSPPPDAWSPSAQSTAALFLLVSNGETERVERSSGSLV